MKLTLINFPMPPSVNNARGSFFNKKTGKKHHYLSSDAKEFYRRAMAYVEREPFRWQAVRRRVLRELAWRDMLALTIDFYFPIDSVLDQSGHFRPLDTSNRIKLLEDAITKYVLKIDDARFQIAGARKRTMPSGLKPYCNVKIEREALDGFPEVYPRAEPAPSRMDQDA